MFMAKFKPGKILKGYDKKIKAMGGIYYLPNEKKKFYQLYL